MMLTFREFIEHMNKNQLVISETAYEKDLEDHEPRIVSGVKGMKSRPFSKKFKNADHMEKWLDSDVAGDHEVHYISRA